MRKRVAFYHSSFMIGALIVGDASRMINVVTGTCLFCIVAIEHNCHTFFSCIVATYISKFLNAI